MLPSNNSSLSLKQVIEKYKLLLNYSFSKSLGQNFLIDLSITDRIAQSAGSLSDVTVIEVGPGPGGLTRSILGCNPLQVIAVERDSQCIQALTEIQSKNLTVIKADALKVKPQDLASGPLKIIANLPYNIGTTLLTNWFEDLTDIQSMTLMFQKEVGARLCALPGSKDYGRLSILTQYLCNVRRLFDLPPQVFTPAPKVHSSVMFLTPKDLSAEEKGLVKYLEPITRALFGQRRKMIHKSLKQIFDEETINIFLKTLDIPPTIRAETLPVSKFVELAKLSREREVTTQKLVAASLKVRQESMVVNAEFERIEHDPTD